MLKRDSGHTNRPLRQKWNTRSLPWKLSVLSWRIDLLFLVRLCASPSLSLCGQAACASMLIIRTNRDEGGRMGYTPCRREGWMKEWKTQQNQREGMRGNTRELFLVVHTNFHRDPYHCIALKNHNHNTNTRHSAPENNINSNSTPYHAYISPEGLK